MKIIISTCVLILSIAVSAQGQNMGEVDIQKMGQAMQEIMQCMSKIDQADLMALEEKSEQFDREMEELCSQGKRNKAQKKAVTYGKEIKKNPTLKQMMECGEINKKYGIPQGEDEASIMDSDFDFSKDHVCDDY